MRAEHAVEMLIGRPSLSKLDRGSQYPREGIGGPRCDAAAAVMGKYSRCAEPRLDVLTRLQTDHASVRQLTQYRLFYTSLNQFRRGLRRVWNVRMIVFRPVQHVGRARQGVLRFQRFS